MTRVPVLAYIMLGFLEIKLQYFVYTNRPVG